MVALPLYDGDNNCFIHIVIETATLNDEEGLMNHFKKLLPHYMIPAKGHAVAKFPLNISNKIDRKQLLQRIKGEN